MSDFSLTAALLCGLAAAASLQAAPSQVFATQIQPLLEAQCYSCHGDDEKPKGGMNLEKYDTEAKVMQELKEWRIVAEKVESLQMPPPRGKHALSKAQRQLIADWLAELAARPDPALNAPDPGKPILRRLTRLEYNNSIRDLFWLEMDIFIFPERLPLGSRSYYDPQKPFGSSLQAPMREYGLKYPVLLPELGLPGENRVEHGFRNRGEGMNTSPMLLEQYLGAAREIAFSPKLPLLSPQYKRLIADPGLPQPEELPEREPSAERPEWTSSLEFAPNLNLPHQSQGSLNVTKPYQLRFAMQTAVAEGAGGVWDAAGKNLVIPAKQPIRVKFGPRGEKSLVMTPEEPLWVAGFSTAGETSGESLFTNHTKLAKRLTLDLQLQGGLPGEGVVELAVCLLSRAGESGLVSVTIVCSDGSRTTQTHELREGEGRGNTFFGFRVEPGAAIQQLVIDGGGFSGNHVLCDDLAFLTNGNDVAKTLANQPQAERSKLSKREEEKEAYTRLGDFTALALRSPSDAKRVERYLNVFRAARSSGSSFPQAMKSAVAAALASPEFLFLAESGAGAPASPSVAPLSDYELASRLAYFLWASGPDYALLQAAAAGELRTDAGLRRQTTRMLRDSRSRELAESFATQWLRLDQLTTAKPDPTLFPEFYSGTAGKVTLHTSMLVEALLLFQTVLVENRSVLDFLGADWTWVNLRMAKLYGLPAPELGKQRQNSDVLIDAKLNAKWQRVSLPDKRRGGYLTMAGPLTVTSLPTRTSPVKRGAWLLETFFNRPPQEPKIAFVLKEAETATAAKSDSGGPQTVRARFEEHRSQASCATCHIRIDPPGFALESFDAIGAWRREEAGSPIDATATWNGRDFDGPVEYKQLLMAAPDEFLRGFVEHLLSYALSRELEITDGPAVNRILAATAENGHALQDIIHQIILSYPFRNLRL
jgi:mono/diheme cytochrome c family protein